MKQEKGFTMIELIVVIVILGILAATALPRFSNLSSDARAAKMNGLVGALKTATAVTHGIALVKGNPAGSSVTMDDGTIVGMSGYFPDSTASGIATALNLATSDFVSYVATGNANVVFYPDAAHQLTGQCGVSYVPAAMVGTTWGAPNFVYYATTGTTAGISSGQCI